MNLIELCKEKPWIIITNKHGIDRDDPINELLESLNSSISFEAMKHIVHSYVLYSDDDRSRFIELMKKEHVEKNNHNIYTTLQKFKTISEGKIINVEHLLSNWDIYAHIYPSIVKKLIDDEKYENIKTQLESKKLGWYNILTISSIQHSFNILSWLPIDLDDNYIDHIFPNHSQWFSRSDIEKIDISKFAKVRYSTGSTVEEKMSSLEKYIKSMVSKYFNDETDPRFTGGNGMPNKYFIEILGRVLHTYCDDDLDLLMRIYFTDAFRNVDYCKLGLWFINKNIFDKILQKHKDDARWKDLVDPSNYPPRFINRIHNIMINTDYKVEDIYIPADPALYEKVDMITYILNSSFNENDKYTEEIGSLNGDQIDMLYDLIKEEGAKSNARRITKD